LELRGIGRRLRGDKWLIQDVSFRLQAGDRLGISGPSGSGKTLLLRAAALLDPVDAGELFWRGVSVADRHVTEFRSRVIYLHQSPSIGEGDVEVALREPLRLQVHSDRRFDRRRIVDYLKQFGRDERFLAKSSRDLSGGEAQIVALLRALQLDPAVLLLDEPTAAMDRGTTQVAEELVDAWLREVADRRAYAWVSHDAEQSSRVRNCRLSLMADGRALAGHQGSQQSG